MTATDETIISTDDAFASMSAGAYEHICQESGVTEDNLDKLQGWERDTRYGGYTPVWAPDYDPADDDATDNGN